MAFHLSKSAHDEKISNACERVAEGEVSEARQLFKTLVSCLQNTIQFNSFLFKLKN